jgi:hypothetical protein
VNQDLSKLLKLDFSGVGCWLTLLLVCLLLGSVGLNWVINSILVVIAILFLLPVVAWVGFNWWVKRNVVEGSCPVCNYTFVGFNQQQCQCPSCGEALKVENQMFVRLTPPGTIDVDAVEVEVQVQQLED